MRSRGSLVLKVVTAWPNRCIYLSFLPYLLWRESLPSGSMLGSCLSHRRSRFFFWWLCLNKLPTRANLILRGMDIPNLCVRCGFWGEEILHVVWLYKQVRGVWARSKISHLWRPEGYSDIMALMWYLSDNVSMAIFEEVVVILWGLWSGRNKILQGQLVSSEGLLEWAKTYLQTFKAAQTSGLRTLHPQSWRIGIP